MAPAPKMAWQDHQLTGYSDGYSDGVPREASWVFFSRKAMRCTQTKLGKNRRAAQFDHKLVGLAVAIQKMLIQCHSSKER